MSYTPPMRRRAGSFALAGAAIAALLSGARQAAAAPPATEPEPLRIEVEAVAGCPSREAVISGMRARTTRWRFAADHERARTFIISARADADGYVGRLSVRTPDGAESAREVRGPSCDEAVAAATLIAAVAIDAEAAEPSPRAVPLPPPQPSAPPVAPARPPARAPGPSLGLALGVEGGAVFGVLPQPAFVGRVFVEATLRRTPLSPSLRLSVARALTQHADTADGTATLTWTAGRIDACPVRLPLTESRWRVAPCLTLDAGAHTGEGTNTRDPASAARPWLAFGALARLEVKLVGALFLDVEMGGAVSALHYRFYFAPDATAYTTPTFVGHAAGAFGVRFL